MAHANELLGFLHAFYGAGATIAPTIATALITQADWQWYQYYYIMAGGAAIELATLLPGFWNYSGAAYRAQHAVMLETEESSPSPVLLQDTPSGARQWHGIIQKLFPSRSNALRTKVKSRTAEAMSSRTTWLCSLFLLVYCGIEGTLSISKQSILR
jgi:MFS family permease